MRCDGASTGRRWRLLGAVAVCVAALGAAAPAEASVWRGTTLNAFGYGPTVARKDLDLNQQAGATAVRIDISWAGLQPVDRDHYDAAYVAQVDEYLAQAASRGLKVIAIVQGTPCWASSAPASVRTGCGGDVGVYPPVNASDYAAAVAYVGQRWGSKLAALEVWNEPNNADFWRSSAPASDYARLLRAAYPALKAAAPALTVLGGALLWSDRDFLDALYANGIHGFFDALSIHPYDPPNGATYGPKYTFAQGVPWVHEGMVAHGDGDKQLWLTEFGWPTCPGTLFWWCVSEAEQASRLTDALRTAEAWPYVGAEIIYTLRDPGSAPDNWQHHMGLLRYDYSAKPAWDAFTDALAARPTATGNRAPLARGSNLASSPAIGTVSDNTPPGVKGYGVSNRVFVVGSRSTPTFGFATKNPTNKGGRHETGTTFRYTLSEAATVRLTIARGRSGRQDHKRCVAPTHRLANARKCIRIFVKGTLTRTSHQGPNRIFLSGRIASQALSPGGYQATLTATDAAKNISKPKTITFTIVRR